MERLLYYPSFFIQDESWLKFALLYMTEINTIVPEDADIQLTQVHQTILRETDLLVSYRPNFDERIETTKMALTKIDSELNSVFAKASKRDRIDYGLYETWRNPNLQNFELFSSKFSYQLETYCLENGFAQRTENGVIIHEDIGNLYMSILADEIANKNDMSIITDMKDHKNKKRIVRSPYYSKRIIQTSNSIKKFIELKIPMKIEDIQLEDIIKLRNTQSYQQKLKEFQKLVDVMINQPNYKVNENTPSDIERLLIEGQQGLAFELLDLGIALTGTIIGITSSFNGNISEQVREGLGIGSVGTSLRPLHTRLQDRKTRKKAASFVTDISKLQVNSYYKEGIIGRK
ncbi:hypothetical protein ACQKNX_11525 [Lysinibacillus sp. NPDC093712]|uniref:hypothetical protein n=1 Tax=Lysinibacillus sp. NPDC093712 TaxID=3390579 RepID=UPI003D046B43